MSVDQLAKRVISTLVFSVAMTIVMYLVNELVAWLDPSQAAEGGGALGALGAWVRPGGGGLRLTSHEATIRASLVRPAQVATRLDDMQCLLKFHLF